MTNLTEKMTSAITEAAKVDNKLASAILVAIEHDNVQQKIYMSLNKRDIVKRVYKARLPRITPGPEKSIMIGEFLDALYTDTGFYMDGGDLVNGDKTIVANVQTFKWGGLINELDKHYKRQ